MRTIFKTFDETPVTISLKDKEKANVEFSLKNESKIRVGIQAEDGTPVISTLKRFLLTLLQRNSGMDTMEKAVKVKFLPENILW